MYTINIKHSQIISTLCDKWGGESIGTFPVENKETQDGAIVQALRNLFRDTAFTEKVRARILSIPDVTKQERLRTALDEVLSINNRITAIHTQVRGQLFALLGDVKRTA